MQFAKFDIGLFLREHWQRKPLLIRNPWTDWTNPLEPDELAGLACESAVESRLVLRAGDGWSLEHGPVPEARFATLGAEPWTLLVQAVDHHAADVTALIEPFRFIPNWRIDDVMVSYATDGGGVGPHFDQYDVFLIQGLGRRRWRVGAVCDEETQLLPHDDLRLLDHFEATEEWVLEPGDILYLPPRFAHDGVAVGDDCMTYSIGFRAPSRSELIAAWCDDALADLPEDDRYADPGLPLQDNPGEISAQALDRLHAMIAERLMDREAFARTFGRHSSTRRYPDIDWRPDEPMEIAELRARLEQGAALSRNPASRFSFVAHAADALSLFVDGQCFECRGDAAAFARSLCAADRVEAGPDLTDDALATIRALCNQGSIAFDEED
ncbi:cupin domain-containing protein [Sphingobium cloacae]|uniref:Transcription factor jumonji JmjC n=1 Tax=Sphingobium cloacae TaxID=120107 RepID=A0A1E1F6C8_9SPHN|nr:cupin domain-containing protein [Sphingobium cloacae]BAV66070.1 transcription factor jumonji JmjC [Sphingobium cloacae]